MAKAVEVALKERRHLIVEAGTGTGKTLAYLLPALRTGQRVIVSTGTKALQDQLYFRDVPFLETLLGSLRVCYMKGRANYLCRQKLYDLQRSPALPMELDAHAAILRKIREWDDATEMGDRAELAGLLRAGGPKKVVTVLRAGKEVDVNVSWEPAADVKAKQ